MPSFPQGAGADTIVLLPFRGVGELSGPELDERHALRGFCVALIRAILQHSYYEADHPQAANVTEEPSVLIERLRDRYAELTFAVAAADDERDRTTVLDGVFSDAVPIERIIGGAAGAHFSSKLHTFCWRNRLVSLSIKSVIRDAEFGRFVSVFVRSHANATLDEEDRIPFTEALHEAGVFNVSVVLNEDLIVARRRLPWRVRLALSRLQKDLRVIPLYAKATAEQLRDAKMRLLRDILRPLAEPAYLSQFFLNLDLIQSEVRELHEGDVEADLMSALPPNLVIAVVPILMVELEKLQHGYRSPSLPADIEQTVERQLARAGRRLTTHLEVAGAAQLINDLYARRLLSFQDLPPTLQRRYRTDHIAASLRKAPSLLVHRLQTLPDPAAYRETLRDALTVMPRLLAEGERELAEQLLEVILAHRQEPGGFPLRERMATMALSGADDPIAAGLVEGLVQGTQDDQFVIRSVLVALGPSAARPLIAALESTRDPRVAAEIELAMTEVDADTVLAVVRLLEGGQLKPRVTAHLLRALGQRRDKSLGKIILRYAQDPSSSVRAAAIDGLVAVHGRAATPLLRHAMNDPREEVAMHAIDLHLALQARSREFVILLVQFVTNQPNVRGRRPAGQLRMKAISALARLGNVRFGEHGNLEGLLVRELGERPIERSRFGLRKGPREFPDDEVRVAMVDALAEIGGQEAMRRLQRNAEEASDAVRESMRWAVARLGARVVMPEEPQK